jgi:hypothetical protein
MTTSSVRETLLPGRGVGLVAARDIAAGECVVVEAAVLTGVSEEFRGSCCACCLRPATAADTAPPRVDAMPVHNRNPQPSTLNSQLSTLDPQPRALRREP